ncbi:MAG: hypothetical protein JXQ74_01445, partial [Alphaproteobacteria bacterium]|nr:hypothetical protein [Alphaproteobacteria bacterium]
MKNLFLFALTVCFISFSSITFALDGEVQGEEPYPPSVQQLDRIDVYSPREGDAFIINLAMNYKSFALYEACLMKDYTSGERFAQKSIAAYSGERVLPEDPTNWAVANEHIVEVNRAYENLTYVLRRSAADTFPALTAEAQAKFDCWVEQATENTQPTHIDECRNRYYAAIHALNEKFDFMFIKNREKKEKTKCHKKKSCGKVEKRKTTVASYEKANTTEPAGESVQILTPVQMEENPVTREEFEALKNKVDTMEIFLNDLREQFENINVPKTDENATLTIKTDDKIETFEIFFDFDSAEIKQEYHDVLHR